MKIEVLHEKPNLCTEKYPIVFVHGGYMGAWCWKPYFFPFFKEKGYECYAPSLRGHGNSEGHESIQKHSFYDYIKDVLQLVRQIERKCILVGHSMGGAIVQKICDTHPEHIAAMVLLSSPSPTGMGMKTGLELMGRGMKQVWSVTMFHRGRINEKNIAEKFPFRWFFSDYMDKEEQIKYARKMTRESDKASKQITKKYVKNPAGMKLPKCIIGGEDDWYFSPETQSQNAKIYGIEAIIVPKIAHNVMLDKNWEQVAKEIHKFIETLQEDEKVYDK